MEKSLIRIIEEMSVIINLSHLNVFVFNAKISNKGGFSKKKQNLEICSWNHHKNFHTASLGTIPRLDVVQLFWEKEIYVNLLYVKRLL